MLRAAYLFFFAFLLVGCRPPAIPARPSAAEYAVLGSAMRFTTQALAGHTVDVEPETMPLEDARLQFRRCMPRHMRELFVEAPQATLSKNVAEDWLHLPDGHDATLVSAEASRPNGPVDRFRISRVALSRFRREAFVWIDHTACDRSQDGMRCGEREGALLRAVRDGDGWRVEATDCHSLAFAER